ncbi:MAG: ATP synthase F1 subunit epsilon [candidate division Zixibacteria bacterium]|nr:ATP synthase F1 subunit epsilon [candidate division Zixibacteria bacterium]
MFQLSIVTPEKVIFEGEVVSLLVPGMEGYLGILSNHAPLITALQPGRIEFQDNQDKIQVFSVSGGFVEVSGNKATLLADTAEHFEEIDIDRAQTALERALKALQDKEKVGGTSAPEAKEAARRAANRVRIYKETH